MSFLKTIKVAAAAGIIAFVSFGAQAQGFYGKIGGSYNWGISSHSGKNITTTSAFDHASNSWQFLEQAERVKINFGKGITASSALGYMFTEQLGVELEAGYLFGGENTTSDNRITPDASQSRSINSKMYARMVLLQPSLVMVTRISDKLDLQGKFGIVLGKGTVFMNHHLTRTGFDLISDHSYKGGIGFGLQGGLGLHYKLSDAFSLFSEVRMSNLSYSPSTFHLQKETVNGVDMTDTRKKDLALENEYSFSQTDLDNQNYKGLKEEFHFSSAGLNIGLKYNF